MVLSFRKSCEPDSHSCCCRRGRNVICGRLEELPTSDGPNESAPPPRDSDILSQADDHRDKDTLSFFSPLPPPILLTPPDHRTPRYTHFWSSTSIYIHRPKDTEYTRLYNPVERQDRQPLSRLSTPLIGRIDDKETNHILRDNFRDQSHRHMGIPLSRP